MLLEIPPMVIGHELIDRLTKGCLLHLMLDSALDIKLGTKIRVQEAWACHWMYDDLDDGEKCRSVHPDDNYWYLSDPDCSAGTHGCSADLRGKWREADTMPDHVTRYDLVVAGIGGKYDWEDKIGVRVKLVPR